MHITKLCLTSVRLIYMYVWIIPHKWGLLGRLMVNSCMLVGGCRDQFLMRTPYCTLDRRRFGLRMIWMLLFLPPASFICGFMPLCLEFMTGFPHWWAQAVSSADLCNAFFEHHVHAFLLGARWRRLLWACICLPSLRGSQPSAAAPKAGWTLSWAGWLS